jgi:hypothetical protein
VRLAAARSRDTYLAAQLLAAGPPHRQPEGRGRGGALDPGLAWHLLTDDCDDQDLGGDSFIRRNTERQRQRAVAQLQTLGYQVTLQPAAEHPEDAHIRIRSQVQVLPGPPPGHDQQKRWSLVFQVPARWMHPDQG